MQAPHLVLKSKLCQTFMLLISSFVLYPIQRNLIFKMTKHS